MIVNLLTAHIPAALFIPPMYVCAVLDIGSACGLISVYFPIPGNIWFFGISYNSGFPFLYIRRK